MSSQPSHPLPVASDSASPIDTFSDTIVSSSSRTATPSAPSTSTTASLAALRLKASELAATRSADRSDERRQTAKELAAAMPRCLNCHNKAKLGCTNSRCHACCIATNVLCKAHHTDAVKGSRKRARDAVAAASGSPANREAMLDALAADDAIGLVVTGVVDEAVECGYRVRLLVNGYVCEGVLFDDAYVVTVDTLPDDLTSKQLRHVTLHTLPALHTTTRPLFPPAACPDSAPAAALSKPKVRRPEGYPTGPRSGYVYYTAAMRARAQAAESEEERNAEKPEWAVLTERERAPYVRLAEIDKQRWMREMADWKKKTEEGEATGQSGLINDDETGTGDAG